MTSPSLFSQPVPAKSAHPQSVLLRFGIPFVLFLITLVSTTAVGMRYMHNFLLGAQPLSNDADILPYAWIAHNLHLATTGLPFSLTLITILLAHEFGHYFACRAFNVRSTLPWLLPAPSLSGTFGAVIRLRSRVRNRAALLTIGAAGPIAGFIVALAAVFLGLSLSTYAPGPVVYVQAPLLITIAQSLLRHLPGAGLPPLHLIVPHPILTASWMGLLITALNLIPAGQLDGGHIVYALSPRAHRITTRSAVVVLVLLGIFFWAGWAVWGLILLLPGMRHPKIPDADPLPRKARILAPICAVIFLLAGTYQPFHGYGLRHLLPKLPHRYHLPTATTRSK